MQRKWVKSLMGDTWLRSFDSEIIYVAVPINNYSMIEWTPIKNNISEQSFIQKYKKDFPKGIHIPYTYKWLVHTGYLPCPCHKKNK